MVQQDRLVDTFLALVGINSPSRREAEAMAWAQARLERLGFTVEYDDAGEKIGGDTGNLIARRPGAPGRPSLFLNAHIDTVQPTENIRVVRENGVIRTDGATILGADDKAGVACILEAVESAIEDGVALPTVEVIITVAEEIGLLGSRHFDPARVESRSGWVVDSGWPLESITINSPSQERIVATITGKASHAGARPEEGVSAIVAAARAIAAMPHGRIDLETTANVGVITGGQATNIVAPSCTVIAEARSRDEAKLQRQTRAMVDAFNNAAQDMGAHAEVTVERQYNAFSADPEGREARLAADAMRDIGLQPILSSTGGGMDANNFAAHGMLCCVIGCGYKDIHSVNEHIAEADLATGARLLAAILLRASVSPW